MKTMTIRFDTNQYDTIKTLASHQCRSFSQQVQFLINEGLRAQGSYTPTVVIPLSNQSATKDVDLDDIDFPDEDPNT